MTVKSLLSKLTDREKDIISMLFGVGEYDHEYSVDDVAYKYKKTATCINNIKRNAIEKLQGTNIRKMAV